MIVLLNVTETFMFKVQSPSIVFQLDKDVDILMYPRLIMVLGIHNKIINKDIQQEKLQPVFCPLLICLESNDKEPYINATFGPNLHAHACWNKCEHLMSWHIIGAWDLFIIITFS